MKIMAIITLSAFSILETVVDGHSMLENHVVPLQIIFSLCKCFLHHMYDSSTNMLETLRYNRETIKGAHKRIIDLANTLGLSNATISFIERRVSQDKYILFGGMFVTLAVIVLVIMYLT